MNELIRKEVAATLIAPDPFDPTKTHLASDVASIVNSGRERVAYWREKVAELGELGNQPLDVLKATRKAIADDDKTLTQYAGKYADGIVELVGMRDNVRALEVQIKGPGRSVDAASVRGGLAELAKGIDAAIAAATPKAPARSWVIRVDATDAQFNTLAKAATKAGCPLLSFAVPQSDKAVKVIARWFEENV